MNVRGDLNEPYEESEKRNGEMIQGNISKQLWKQAFEYGKKERHVE